MYDIVPGASIRVVPDRETTVVGAALDGDGIVVVAGGGAIAAGVGPRGERVVLSGYGYRIGEDGSGVDLGRSAVAAALRGWEGRGPATRLTAVVAAAFGVREPREILAAVYGRDFHRSRFAALAPAVLDVAEAGDAVASRLVDAAAGELAAAAAAAATRVYADGECIRIYLTGGLLGNATLLARRVDEKIHAVAPAARVALTPHAAAAGAIALAAKGAGVAVDAEWIARARAHADARLG